VPRVLAEIGAGLARGLDVAGQAVGRVIPAIGGIESAIPGTTLNEESKARQEAKQESQQAALSKTEADTAETKARIPLTEAQTSAIPAETGLKEAQTRALETPKPTLERCTSHYHTVIESPAPHFDLRGIFPALNVGLDLGYLRRENIPASVRYRTA